MRMLTEKELAEVVEREKEWKMEGGKLVRDWVFRDFVGAMTFVNEVAAMAEERGHHPDMDVRYNRVRLGLVTHDAGGVTAKDAEMAGEIGRRFGGST